MIENMRDVFFEIAVGVVLLAAASTAFALTAWICRDCPQRKIVERVEMPTSGYIFFSKR